MAWFTPVLGAVGSLASSALGGLFNRGSSQESGIDPVMMLANYQMQKSMFDYQQNRLESLYNSAHQREVEDLKKAGLNPILSSNGGSGAQSGLASTPDYGSTIGAAASMANTRANNKVALSQALLGVGEKLLDFAIGQQNAVTNRMQAESARMNAESNAANSASQIALNKDIGEKTRADAKMTSDSILNNQYIRENLKSQSVKNYASANEINYLLEPRKDLMEAQQYSSLTSTGVTALRAGLQGFRAALTGGAKVAKGAKNSAKSVKDSGSKLRELHNKHEKHLPNSFNNILDIYENAPDYHDINKIYGGF